ncbi:MAG: tyrosine-type recombinase/integrase, partial [Dehalococcoidia bacterium]
FTQIDGRPIDPDTLSHDFQKIVRTADLPHLTLQGLRHAHATFLLQKGMHAKIVSERLGHSNISVTMDIYSHVLPDMQEAAAQAIDEVLSMPG